MPRRPTPTTPTELAFAGAYEQSRLIRSGEVSATEVVAATLERIAAGEAALNAFRVVWAEQALAAAGGLDRSSARRSAATALAGVPIAVKDDTDVAGEVTGWGLGGGVRATADAPIVALLRRAGAIIIGKTNVPELDLWPWTSSPTFGVTCNPWDRARTPGGSSGGSAAAVAAGMCGLATMLFS